LSGYIGNGRTRILAERSAPITVNYFGYPGTLGATYIDYIIADDCVAPPGAEQFYAERIVRLPGSYFPTDTQRKEYPGMTRSACGLPENAFVFCAFNSSYKLTPELFDIWMRLLRQADNSVLWLIATHPVSKKNLIAEAAARGVSAERLIFAERVSHGRNLARMACADLFLDTLPCNAHTTCSDALWAGLPLLTCAGSSFAARVAASQLLAIGLKELITTNLAAYEALALDLARSPRRLAALRDKLQENRKSWPLFDARKLSRHIERAYETMWQRYRSGGDPIAFSVPDD
jgi:protein O-GlcNAc transferase